VTHDRPLDGWKSFPDNYHGEYIQAPMGPGLYEVCRTSNWEQIAFGCTRNVADSLGDVLKPRGLRKWLSFRGKRSYDTGELEYRTWPTANLAEARATVEQWRRNFFGKRCAALSSLAQHGKA
jgi:hypothetical protein